MKITRAVQTSDSIEQRELPFVVGVLADFSGQAEKPPLRSRHFIEVDRENLDSIFRAIAPGASLSASWRALQYLVARTNSKNIKIRILDVSRKELHRDQLKASDFDQSFLFKKLHDDIFGATDAEPFGIVIGDYEFSNDSADLDLLDKLSQVAAAIHAPFLAAAAPQLLGLDDFVRLAVDQQLHPIFSTKEYAKWRTFRQSEAARYFCLTAPLALLRIDRPSTPEHLPMSDNAAFALAGRIISAFALSGWFASICGSEDGDVTDLQSELALAPWQEKARSESRLVPFAHHGPSDGFGFVPTCHQPAVYEHSESTTTARLVSDLRYVLSVSRFVHYSRVLIRDQKAGSLTNSGRKQMLNDWIEQYVCKGGEPNPAQPLRSAYVDISEPSGSSGLATVSLYALPGLHLEPLIYSIRATFLLPDY